MDAFSGGGKRGWRIARGRECGGVYCLSVLFVLVFVGLLSEFYGILQDS